MAIRHTLVDVAPLRSSPVFRRLWVGRACSGLGSQMTLVAVMFQLWQMTCSIAWIGVVGLAQAIRSSRSGSLPGRSSTESTGGRST